MGLKKFKRTEIRFNVMEIPINITEEVIGKICRRTIEGAFQWNLNKKTSDWISMVRQSLFKGKKDGNYSDMEKFFRSCCKNVFYPKEEV